MTAIRSVEERFLSRHVDGRWRGQCCVASSCGGESKPPGGTRGALIPAISKGGKTRFRRESARPPLMRFLEESHKCSVASLMAGVLAGHGKQVSQVIEADQQYQNMEKSLRELELTVPDSVSKIARKLVDEQKVVFENMPLDKGRPWAPFAEGGDRLDEIRRELLQEARKTLDLN